MDPDCTCTICEIHGYASYIKAQERIRELQNANAELALQNAKLLTDVDMLTAERDQLRNQLDYVHAVICSGFDTGVFDFSVLKQQIQQKH